MKLFTIEYRESMAHVDNETAEAVASDAILTLRALNQLEPVLLTPKEAGRFGDEEFSYEQLDSLDNFLAEISLVNLRNFASYNCASTEGIQRRVNTALYYLDQLVAEAELRSAAYAPMSDEIIEKMKNLTGLVIGELAYFTYFQFGLDVTAASKAEGNELEISPPINDFLSSRREDLETLLTMLSKNVLEHRPQLTIFEQVPELEDAFYEVAGAFIQDFDILGEFVTLDVIKSVIAPGSDVEEIIRELEFKVQSAQKDVKPMSAFEEGN